MASEHSEHLKQILTFVAVKLEDLGLDDWRAELNTLADEAGFLHAAGSMYHHKLNGCDRPWMILPQNRRIGRGKMTTLCPDCRAVQ